jgi:uncharacterized RDD family membrane protein YckC
MVIGDPVVSHHAFNHLHLARPADRFASGVVDTLLTLPIWSLVLKGFSEPMGVALRLENPLLIWQTALAGLLLFTLVSAVWFGLWIRWAGQTPGQRILGLKVVSLEINGDQALLLSQAFQRSAVLVLGALSLGLFWLGALRRHNRQTVHDLLAGTTVVSLNPERSAGQPDLAEQSLAAALGLFATSGLLALSLAIRPQVPPTSIGGLVNDKCERVERALAAWSDRDVTKPSQLEMALVLSALGVLENSCLREMASLTLWQRDATPEQRSLANSLLALSSSDESQLQRDYKAASCKDDNQTLGCWYVSSQLGDQPVERPAGSQPWLMAILDGLSRLDRGEGAMAVTALGQLPVGASPEILQTVRELSLSHVILESGHLDRQSEQEIRLLWGTSDLESRRRWAPRLCMDLAAVGCGAIADEVCRWSIRDKLTAAVGTWSVREQTQGQLAFRCIEGSEDLLAQWKGRELPSPPSEDESAWSRLLRLTASDKSEERTEMVRNWREILNTDVLSRDDTHALALLKAELKREARGTLPQAERRMLARARPGVQEENVERRPAAQRGEP